MSEKIGERHLARRAVLYVRQSTQQQLANNEESRRLQYAMRDRLRTLGWHDIDVIDEDLGKSAAGSVDRGGFRRRVADVSLGQVGAVAAREVSRFARNSRDWQQLIEICRALRALRPFQRVGGEITTRTAPRPADGAPAQSAPHVHANLIPMEIPMHVPIDGYESVDLAQSFLPSDRRPGIAAVPMPIVGERALGASEGPSGAL